MLRLLVLDGRGRIVESDFRDLGGFDPTGRGGIGWGAGPLVFGERGGLPELFGGFGGCGGQFAPGRGPSIP